MADRKKAAELSAGLVAVKGQAVPASDMQPRAASVVPEPVEAEPEVVEPPAPEELQGEPAETEANNQPLNFRVPQAFRREFRVYAASHDLKLNELLQLCFDAYKRRETKSTQA